MAAEEGQVTGCHNLQEWKDQFDKAKDSGKLVHFFPFTHTCMSIFRHVYPLQILDLVLCCFIVVASLI